MSKKMMFGKRWPEDFRYRFFIGMHTVDYDQNGTVPCLLSRMDGREIVRQLADAGVEAIMFYASCHLGNCYYPTEVKWGHMHSGLKGRDVFGEAATECQKLGVAFVPVYEFMNLRILDTGPKEWAHYFPKVAPDSERMLCWNTGYGDMVRAQLEEIVNRYPIAGIWLDMQDAQFPVCCEECARLFKEETGVAPPRRIEDTTLYKIFRVWSYRDAAGYLMEMRKMLQSYSPGTTIVNNTHLFRCEDLYETTDANDYLANDPFVGFSNARSLVEGGAQMALFRALSKGKAPFEILHDNTTHSGNNNLPAESYQAETAIIPANGGASGYPMCMMNQYGELHPQALALTKSTSEFMKARHPWKAEGESLRFAGIYASQECMNNYDSPALGRWRTFLGKYSDEFYGVYLMLQEEHLPLDMLTRRDLMRLSEYPVIYLANVACMSNEEISAIRKYVREGGTIISSYRTSLLNEWGEDRGNFGLADVLGVNWSGQKISPPLDVLEMPLPDGLFTSESWESRVVDLTRQDALVCELRDKAEALTWLHDCHGRDPMTNCIGLINGYYREKPYCPAIVDNRFGKGRSLYLSGRIFADYYETGNPTWRKIAARWLIDDLKKEESLVELKAPQCVELTAYAQPDRNRVLIHLVNVQSIPSRQKMGAPRMRITDEVLPVHDLELTVKLPVDRLTAAYMRPSGETLNICEAGSLSVIEIPRVHQYEIIELVLKEGACPEYPDSDRVLSYTQYDLLEKTRQWLATNPPDYDPDDDGAANFDQWLPADHFLIDWQNIGPFDGESNVDAVFGPEEDSDLTCTYTGKGNQEVGWSEVCGPNVHPNGKIEVERFVGNQVGNVGYALCFLRSSEEQEVCCHLGNDDGCKIFINGKEVFRTEGRELHMQEQGPDTDIIDAHLHEGVNTVMVKKLHVGHRMHFYLRIDQPGHEVRCASRPDAEGRVVIGPQLERKEWDGAGAGQLQS